MYSAATTESTAAPFGRIAEAIVPVLAERPIFAYCSPMLEQASSKTMTRRQKELLDFLTNYIREYGYAPTLEEIGENFGLTSLATVHKHLSNLEGKGPDSPAPRTEPRRRNRTTTTAFSESVELTLAWPRRRRETDRRRTS